jgi:peptidylprolyl isomerase
VLPLRRTALVPALVATLGLSLTACGDDGGSGDGFPGAGETSDRLDAVTIKGDVGTVPEVKWKSQMDAGSIESETITEGDGATFEDGQSALTQIWIGNGFTEKESYSSYDQQRAEQVTLDDQVADFLAPLKGQTFGSRVAITGSADELFGETGNAQLGIGNKDSVLIIVDLVSAIADGPQEDGKKTADPAWMPKITTDDQGLPTGFDFTGTPQPTDDLRRVQLIQGTGPRVKKGQTIAVNYLGQAFGEAAPFDQNFTGDKAQPTTFGIGTGQVIEGWDTGLEGVPVGSRVVLEIPAAQGYGEQGQPDSGIPANATLVFVIDVLGAA